MRTFLLNETGTIPAATIRQEFGGREYRVVPVGPQNLLLVQDRTVIEFKGTVTTRRFTFESTVVDCFYTTFNNTGAPLTPAEAEPVLVIVFRDQIRVYPKQGGAKVISLPFHIRRAFPFKNGIVFNKEPEMESAGVTMTSNGLSGQTLFASPRFSEANFLTLQDPMDDPGLIASSSITSFASKEEISSFPLTENHCLATLFNPSEHTLNVYHVRYLATSRGQRKKSGTYLGLKKPSNAAAASRNISTSSVNQDLLAAVDDDSRAIRSSSTLSYDRMASGTEFGLDSSSIGFGATPFDPQKLHKDIIFTRLSSFAFRADADHLRVFSVLYQDQEAVVVCNLEARTISFYVYTNPGNIMGLPTFKYKFSLTGLSAVAFDARSAKHQGYIAIQEDQSRVVLFNPFLKLMSPPIDLNIYEFPPIRLLDGSFDSTLIIHCEGGTHHLVSLYIWPQDRLVATLLESLRFIANNYIFEHFWLQWCANRSASQVSQKDDWTIFVTTLLSLTSIPGQVRQNGTRSKNLITQLVPKLDNSQERPLFVVVQDKLEDPSGSPTRSDASTTPDCTLDSLLSVIVLSCHLIKEDLRLNTLAAEPLNRLTLFLAQFVSWLGWSDDWLKYYMVDPKDIDRQTRVLMAQPLAKPPNLFESLCSLFTGQIVPYVTFSQLVEEDESVDELIIPRTFYVLRLFEVLLSSQFANDDLIRMMAADYGIKRSDLETYPPGIYIILKNKITQCQRNITSQWNLGADELKLIDRKDLLQFDRMPLKSTSAGTLASSQISAKSLNHSGAKEMSQILKYVSSNEGVSAWDGQAEADKFHVTRLIFSEDRRFYEVTRLLQTSKLQKAYIKLPSSMDENNKLTKQRALGAKVALCTLSMPMGRGAVFISSRTPLVTEKFPIPKINFNALILPDMINVTPEKDTINPYLYDWGYFHNGVSAGLMTSREFKDVSGSWIVFNRPRQLNAQHAGFLLGLGLNGHLKNLEEWHIYNYLGPKHSFTSIGLLLGMAASLKGSMDVKLTKVLSVHVVALLPPGSTDLNVQLPVQTAGLVGIGLLYMGSQHRRMTEMLLSQISSVLTVNERQIVNEGYRLAAGISLGYVNLGKGEYLKESIGTHVIDRLFLLATSVRDIETSQELDKACGGSIMALMFMFLRTNSVDAAQKLAIPTTQQVLDYIRPDLLMLRCLAYNMILWDQVQPTESWVESQIPTCVKQGYHLGAIKRLDSDFLPYFNIVGGCLLSIAIRYASTGNLVAKDTLLTYFDKLMVVCSNTASNYDERTALVGARNIRDVTILGLSIIMSGTGDLEIMRRLRYLQGVTDKYTNYGNYMAANTALGFLFLGGGQQAFRQGDNFSIAALITSVYPVYATNNYDSVAECSEVLLQALRHFWALAVENRCLVVRDMGNTQPVKVDVEIEMNDTSTLRRTSPCLLPDLERIHQIRVCGDNSEDSSKYFSLDFDFRQAPAKQIKAFKKCLTLYAYERSRYQDLKLNFDTMVALEESKSKPVRSTGSAVSCLESLSIFKGLKDYEKRLYFRKETLCESSVIDLKLEVENILKSGSVDKFWNLKLLFNYVDQLRGPNRTDRSKMAPKRKTKGNTILDVDVNMAEEEADDEEDDEYGYNDTFERQVSSRTTAVTQDSASDDDMSYLNIKFIEGLRNELFRSLKSI